MSAQFTHQGNETLVAAIVSNKTGLLHWTYLKLEGMTIMAAFNKVAITSTTQIPGTQVRKSATNLRSVTRTESSSLRKLVRFQKKSKEHHAARGWTKLKWW